MKKYCYTCMEEIRQGNYCMSCMKENEPDIFIHHIQSGTILKDRYLVGKCLREDGSGNTYIGRDLSLDIKVAIKEYYPSGFVNESFDSHRRLITISEKQSELFTKGKSLFLDEAQALVKLGDEPGVETVREYFEENNTAFMVLGYLEGETLDSYLKKHRPFDAEKLFHLVLPIADSLQKIHDAGIIHRDITPENIIYRANGTLSLIDFGSTRYYINTEGAASAVLKTDYAPEELYRKNGEQGPWTDVYALCATMYKCITGQAPEDAVARVREDRLKKPSELGIKISAPLENVLMHGLEVNCKNRFQSMKELSDSIRKAICKEEENRIINKKMDAEDHVYKTQAVDDYYRTQAIDDFDLNRNPPEIGAKICPRCKAIIRTEDRYCTNCGYDFRGKKREGNLLLYIILGLVLILLAITSVLLFGGRDSEKNTGNESAAETMAAEETAAQEPADNAAQPDPASESAEPTSPAVSMGFVAEVLASSFLDSQYGNTYYPYNAVDSDINSAWVEGQGGQGVGETLTIRLDRRALVSGIDIYSGYQKESSLFYKNSRPETILISFSDGTSETITLRDMLGSQHIVFSSPVETNEVVLTIRSVFPGSTYTDTAISEISLF